MAKLDEVFGVSAKQVLSYVERGQVDGAFKGALETRKPVIVYGSSKQGKTALVNKYLPYEDNILVSLTPKYELLDIYQKILKDAGVRLVSQVSEKSGTEQEVSFVARFKAMIPIFGGAEAEAAGKTSANSEAETQYEEILVKLDLPQNVADLLDRVNCRKWVILENFHYLPDSVQRQFAFDLRAFQELGVQFVILGVWREKNRMAQFNGDLLDRFTEVPVEPWDKNDFRRVVEKGGQELRIKLDGNLVDSAIESSFSSIGVFQELLKNICAAAGVLETVCGREMQISDVALLKAAIDIKTDNYSARHQRALEAIAAGHASGGGAKGDKAPLYLPYYLVSSILSHGFTGIENGVRRQVLHEWIRQGHHRGNDVRASDMTNLLDGLANLQSVKSISPPIFAYDAQQRVLQVVDSTFYFFIKNADMKSVIEEIPNPLEEAA